MLTITRTHADNGEQYFSEPFPDGSLCNVWVGDTCTVYMPARFVVVADWLPILVPGDEEALAEFRASMPPPPVSTEEPLENE